MTADGRSRENICNNWHINFISNSRQHIKTKEAAPASHLSQLQSNAGTALVTLGQLCADHGSGPRGTTRASGSGVSSHCGKWIPGGGVRTRQVGNTSLKNSCRVICDRIFNLEAGREQGGPVGGAGSALVGDGWQRGGR